MKNPQNNQHSKKKNCCKHDVENISIPIKKFFESLMLYKPLIIIIIFCLLIPAIRINPFNLQQFTYSVMGYFFIFLSLFKFLDLKGFVEGFATYDIITKRLRLYGYIYPFIEFSLGITYLTIETNLSTINWFTLIIMSISGLGVLDSIFSGQKLKCACLGTTLNVPLSAVSVLENFGMAVMAAYKLVS